MAETVTAGAAFAFINSALKLSEYATRLYSVESENGVFVRMIKRVRLDVEEAERLLSVPSVNTKLISIPGKLPWIKEAIVGAKATLDDIGRWADRVRAEQEGYGSVSWENKVRWVFSDHDKLVHRRMELGISYQALSNVLQYLASLEEAEPAEDATPPLYGDATFFDDFLSPRQKRKIAWDKEKSAVADRELYSGGDGRISGGENSPPASNPSLSPRSTTTGSISISSPHPTIVESNPFPNSPPMTTQPAATPLTPSRARTNSLRYGEQIDSHVPPTTISSWPTTALGRSTLAAQQADKMTSLRSLDPNTYVSNTDPRNLHSYQHTSSTLPPVPHPPSQQRFSATNTLGPIDPFELFTESSNQVSLIRSRDVHPVGVDSSSAALHHIYHQTPPPLPPKTYESSAQIDTVTKMIENVSICQPEKESPPAQTSQVISTTQAPLTDSFNGLERAASRQEGSNAPSLMQGDAVNRHATRSASMIELPAENHRTIEKSQNASQIYADAPELQISQELGQWHVTPPIYEAIAATTAQTAPLARARSETLAEVRRKNQKALLALMEHESYG